MSHSTQGVRGSELSAVKFVCASDSNSRIFCAQGVQLLSFVCKLLMKLYMSHTVLSGPQIFADFMKLMLLLGVVSKRSSSITEGVGGDVIIQGQFGKSAVVRRKHTCPHRLC